MTKNQKTYLLLGLVVGIWGLLGFKFVSSLNPTVRAVQKVNKTVQFEPKTVIQRDTFSLIANYRDPFLGTLPRSLRKKKPATSPSDKKEIPRKNIAYSGFLSEANSKDLTFFVSIEGQQYMMNKRDKIQEVTLVSGNKTSIQVAYNGISQKIPLSQ